MKKDELVTCYNCIHFEELDDSLLNNGKPPKECKKCAWQNVGDELPLKKRPNYIEAWM